MKNKQTLQNCYLCHPDKNTTLQFRILFKNLVQKLEKQKENMSQQKNQAFESQNFFYQLLKCIFEHTSACKNVPWDCNHQFLNVYVQNKIKVDRQSLQIISQSLFFKITRRRYQFQLIKNTTKSFPKTIIKENFNKNKCKSECNKCQNVLVQEIKNQIKPNSSQFQNTVLKNSQIFKIIKQKQNFGNEGSYLETNNAVQKYKNNSNLIHQIQQTKSICKVLLQISHIFCHSIIFHSIIIKFQVGPTFFQIMADEIQINQKKDFILVFYMLNIESKCVKLVSNSNYHQKSRKLKFKNAMININQKIKSKTPYFKLFS